ncbi:MAG: HNH endonuclease [Chloroflexi bacterium]|nr:HNH endonuclease [Chloroflexota bacterium]
MRYRSKNEIVWENWLERLYNLRRDKSGGHERPHKPILLLSIIELLDRAAIRENTVTLSEELLETFKRNFAAVRKHDDQPTIQNPFFHLCGDKFWHLVPLSGEAEIYREGSTSGAPSVAELRRRVAYGQFDAELWTLLSEPIARHQLREAMMARYFPDEREELAALAGASRASVRQEALRGELPPGRDAAFRRTILEVYDHRCAACGIRVLLGQEALVEAAHLIPFKLSRNDKPTNSVALCPNHHWAMDHSLIAPCPDAKKPAGVWRVNRERLDDRIEGQRDLAALAGQSVIPPSEEKFYPAIESLRWRQAHLITAY